MKNITEQQKAEARAYNDTIKNNMSIENKLEILKVLVAHSTNSNNLEFILNKVIDVYSENGESLEPKVKELIAKKEANQ